MNTGEHASSVFELLYPARAKKFKAAAKAKRATKIKRIADKLVDRDRKHASPRPLRLQKRKGRERKIIAYDFETTPIRKGNPTPVYLTAYGDNFIFDGRCNGIEHLRELLTNRFLTDDNKRARFVAWNANKFDVYFIGAALLHDSRYVLRPYLTKSSALRGISVKDKETGNEWEFLDGLSMTLGNKACTLKEFLKTFAPDYHKLDGPNFEAGEEFDPDNADHRMYAFRDSEGLYHAMMRAQSIVQEHFEQVLQPTIGNLGIRLFQQEMPADVEVWSAPYEIDRIIRKRVMRGGFCFCTRKYVGPVWKYDLNQAYCAAMRECMLPCGRGFKTREYIEGACGIYCVNASNNRNKIPFYVIESTGGGAGIFSVLEGHWITSNEYEQLKAEGWRINIIEGYAWEESFTMQEYVNKLERLRIGAPGGPKSAQGEMMKAIGNNSYGKTVEELGGYETILAAECPDGFISWQDAGEAIENIWVRFTEPQQRDYHQPQLGAFITAHVRMVVRRAILEAPDAWIYADTDCVVFTRPVSLDIDPGRYGAWKIEAEGEAYRFITKKVYCALDGSDMKAKGMTVKKLNLDDFAAWYDGRPPTIKQVQRQNFLKVMNGGEMFVERVKTGQNMNRKESPQRVRA